MSPCGSDDVLSQEQQTLFLWGHLFTVIPVLNKPHIQHFWFYDSVILTETL